MGEMLQWIRAHPFGGLNLLEWIGAVSATSLVIYAFTRPRIRISRDRVLKDRPSGVAGRRRPAVPAAIRQPLEDLPRGNETILLVDDDAAVLRTHARLIGRLGYRVHRAVGGENAVKFIREHPADLIVLDLLMPGMDGIETLRQLRTVNPSQRAIVLSGFAGPAMVSSMRTLGVNTYLIKPAELGTLARAIRDELDRS